MARCPVCEEEIHADTAAFAHHVNSHFEDKPGQSSTTPTARGVPESCDCPLCGFPLTRVDQHQRQLHINTCGDSQGTPGAVADRPISPYTLEDDYDHDEDQDRSEDETAYAALDRRKGGRSTKSVAEWDGPAKPGAWQGWVGRKIEKGDEYWDPADRAVSTLSTVPRNFSPGLIGVLAQMLEASMRLGKTRAASLSRDAVHIRGVWGFDMGFGCGYRNALMAISALSLHDETVHRSFSKEANGVHPGLRRIQGWIEEAWAAGYDTEGRDQLKGKLLGTRKWIGATDLYAMFTCKGVRCELYDFKKPERGLGYRPAHKALQEWVKIYFGPTDEAKPAPSHSAGNAHDTLMSAAKNRSSRVHQSYKYPLVLQHAGHSRTIVGYEESAKGEINLLLFDPGKRAVPAELRTAGLASVRASASGSGGPSGLSRIKTASAPSLSRQRASHESISFSRPYTNGASELVHLPEDAGVSHTMMPPSSGPVRIQGGGGLPLEDDEYEDEHGWVKKKIRKITRVGSRGGEGGRPSAASSGNEPTARDPWADMGLGKALSYFRVNLASLGTHAQYQILAFPGGPLLTPAEQHSRKTISSTEVW